MGMRIVHHVGSRGQDYDVVAAKLPDDIEVGHVVYTRRQGRLNILSFEVDDEYRDGVPQFLLHYLKRQAGEGETLRMPVLPNETSLQDLLRNEGFRCSRVRRMISDDSNSSVYEMEYALE